MMVAAATASKDTTPLSLRPFGENCARERIGPLTSTEVPGSYVKVQA
jgi:hypothetical protein